MPNKTFLMCPDGKLLKVLKPQAPPSHMQVYKKRHAQLFIFILFILILFNASAIIFRIIPKFLHLQELSMPHKLFHRCKKFNMPTWVEFFTFDPQNNY